jgi:DNA modification methylase
MSRTVIKELRLALQALKPWHDSPIGLVHPYWARKPLNVVDTIITKLSRPGESIMDPFMGSGTIVLSALTHGRSAFGSDINPLSIFLVKAILELGLEPDSIKKYADSFLSLLRDSVLPWYKVKNKNEYIERERFTVIGKYENGRFSLQRTETITKMRKGDKWIGRRTYNEHDKLVIESKPNSQLISIPVDFEKLELLPNSRIAIPKGAKLSHYFTKTNRAAINYALSLSEQKGLTKEEKTFRRLLVSSSLPLLRLSDKKASSQWPYWRPKKLLTSRNPVIVFEGRVESIKNMVSWVNERIPKYYFVKEFSKSNSLLVSVEKRAVQDLPRRFKCDQKFNLILTDPPYSDQVPYLEYSSLWISLLELGKIKKLYSQEIVRSDCPIRANDSADYIRRLSKGFDACCRLVHKNGHVVWFYQDYDLLHWRKLNDIAKKNGMVMVDVIPIPKQRRSMKTVTSPGRTLDGDLILIFKKNGNMRPEKRIANLEDIMQNLRIKASLIEGPNRRFEIYAMTIAHILRTNQIDIISKQFRDVREVLSIIAKEL